MNKVFIANKNKGSHAMGSSGDALYMIIKQYLFPNTYLNEEQMCSFDSDTLILADYDYTTECCKRHTGTYEGGLSKWFEEATDAQIMAFIKEFTKADPAVEWTGFRVLGTSSFRARSAGPVFTLELFAKKPGSITKVYTGLEAPNVYTR